MKFITEWKLSDESIETIAIHRRINNDFREFKATASKKDDLVDYLTSKCNFVILTAKESPHVIINSDTNVGLFYTKEISLPRVHKGKVLKKKNATVFCADWKLKRII